MPEEDLVACYICQKIFPRYNRISKFCSAKCRTSSKSALLRSEVTCPWCSTVFMQGKGNARYCSQLCRERFRAAAAKKSMPEKACKICAKMFAPVCGSHAYCSDICRILGEQAVKKKSQSRPESKKRTHEYNQQYHKHNYKPGSRQSKKENLARCYGLAIDDYEAMIEEQHGLCHICHQPPPGRYTLCVDHSHVTGKVRRLLCLLCNNLLGNCRESQEILDSAKAYLLKFNGP